MLGQGSRRADKGYMLRTRGKLDEHLLVTAIIHDAVLAIRMYSGPGRGPRTIRRWFGLAQDRIIPDGDPNWAPAWMIADLIHNSTGDREHEFYGIPGWAEALVNMAVRVPNMDNHEDGRRTVAWLDRTLHTWGWTMEEFLAASERWKASADHAVW